MLKHHTYRIAPSTLWPRIPGQSSLVDCNRGQIALDDHSRPIPENAEDWSQGAVQPPPPYVTPTGATFVAVPRSSASISSGDTRKEGPSPTRTIVQGARTPSTSTTSKENRDGLKRRLDALREKFTRKGLTKAKKPPQLTPGETKNKEPCMRAETSVSIPSRAESHTTFGSDGRASRRTLRRRDSRPRREAVERTETDASGLKEKSSTVEIEVKRHIELKFKKSTTELRAKEPKAVALRNVASMRELRRKESRADLRGKDSRPNLGQKEPRFILRGIVSRLDLLSSARRKPDEVHDNGE